MCKISGLYVLFTTKYPDRSWRKWNNCSICWCFTVFPALISLKTWKLLDTSSEKYSSVKSDKIFSKWQKFLPTNIFCRWNFPPMKFLPIRYFDHWILKPILLEKAEHSAFENGVIYYFCENLKPKYWVLKRFLETGTRLPNLKLTNFEGVMSKNYPKKFYWLKRQRISFSFEKVTLQEGQRRSFFKKLWERLNFVRVSTEKF